MPADHPSELHELFTAAINSADIDGLVALFETDGAAVHLDGSVVAGQPALRAMFRELLTMIKQIEGTTRKVFVLGDMALTSAEWCANAGTPEEMSGTSAEVARRQPDGTWRFVIDDPMFGSCRPADYSSPPKESQ